MLASVLDAKITNNVVRLGSRTTDPRIEQYSLYKLEQRSGRGDLDRTIGREFAAMKRAEEKITHIMNRMQVPGLTWEDAERFLDSHYPQHANSLREPPFWIAERFRRDTEDENLHGRWTQVQQRRKKASRDAEIAGVYGFWKNCRDIEFLQLRPPPTGEEENEEGTSTDPRVTFFTDLGFDGPIPPVPTTSRLLEQLTGVDNVWTMSRYERQRLAESWEDGMRTLTYELLLTEFDKLKQQYMDACKTYADTKDEVSRLDDHYSRVY
jgi:hypothetical protein